MNHDILHSFLEKHFENLILSPSLFYSWKNSIRFEISNPLIPYYKKEHLEQAFYRSIRLFEAVFGEEDELLLVTDVHAIKKDIFLQKRPLNVYLKYIKDKKKLYQLSHYLLPSVFDEEDDQSITHRFILSCKKSELKYVQLLKAICYEDFTHPSNILKSNPQSGYDIYFINLSKEIIFHLYDDRGCDVLASNKESIEFLYEEYNHWILDYDREEIDLLFK
ncbi:DUF3885 domain-containing protein (plasmid) [Priestia megaterium]|uniref:DUF3885 domain-containing protein n=1 Tax=Priestia megaterium TaxID=1404 RepID=UPI002057131E|nr:DUF3885 domain-containing protein [Priestia megaterium]UOO43785.1 DUF3885 domain-containing protein [Priestia megaterium]